MGRFRKKFLDNRVTEWVDSYLNYKLLAKQIHRINQAAQDLAKATELAQIEKHISAADSLFWQILVVELKKVQRFYSLNMTKLTDQFHVLTYQAIQLGLLEEYIPFTRGLSTRLERELERLDLSLSEEFLPLRLQRKKKLKRQLQQEKNYLVRLNKESTYKDVFERENEMITDLTDTTDSENSFIDHRDVNIPLGVIQQKAHTKPSGKPSVAASNTNSSAGETEVAASAAPSIATHTDITPESSKKDSTVIPDITSTTITTSNFPVTTTVTTTVIKETASTSSASTAVSHFEPGNSEHQEAVSDSSPTLPAAEHDKEKAKNTLRHAFIEYYRRLMMIQGFSTLNSEAVEKIIRKYRKNIGLAGAERFEEELAQYTFFKSRSHQILMQETEHVYAMSFEEGHYTSARKALRKQKRKKKILPTYLSGLFTGLSIILAIICIYLLAILQRDKITTILMVLISYRVIMCLILLLAWWGIDIYVWSQYRINYPFIFEFSLNTHIGPQTIIRAATFLVLIFLVSVFLMLLAVYHPTGFLWMGAIHPSIFPLILFFFLLACFLYIKPWLFLRVLLGITLAPFFSLQFRDFYLADQLVSLNIVLIDFEQCLCYYFYDVWFPDAGPTCSTSHTWIVPVLGSFPYIWRVLQCLRRLRDTEDIWQLVNSFKYCLGIMVILFSFLYTKFGQNTIFFYTWIGFAVVASLYSWLWDVYKDWSLGQTLYNGLRKDKAYPNFWYYLAIIFNFGLRLSWSLTLSMAIVDQHPSKDITITILAVLEIFRRGFWNIFRLENEQINNIGKYRVLRDIPLPLSVSL